MSRPAPPLGRSPAPRPAATRDADMFTVFSGKRPPPPRPHHPHPHHPRRSLPVVAGREGEGEGTTTTTPASRRAPGPAAALRAPLLAPAPRGSHRPREPPGGTVGQLCPCPANTPTHPPANHPQLLRPPAAVDPSLGPGSGREVRCRPLGCRGDAAVGGKSPGPRESSRPV